MKITKELVASIVEEALLRRRMVRVTFKMLDEGEMVRLNYVLGLVNLNMALIPKGYDVVLLSAMTSHHWEKDEDRTTILTFTVGFKDIWFVSVILPIIESIEAVR